MKKRVSAFVIFILLLVQIAPLRVRGENPASDDAESSLFSMADDEVSGSDNGSDWGAAAMRFPEAVGQARAARENGNLDSSVLVAVIDTGINTSHELFEGRISSDSRSFLPDRSSYEDENGHGTHVAGVIAENTTDNVKLLILQALDSEKRGSAETVAQAILYAVERKAEIINLSLGFSRQDFADESEYLHSKELIRDAAAKAWESGCIIVTSAGNDGNSVEEIGAYPAIEPSVVTVSAVEHDLSHYARSNYGDAVDFAAPGAEIRSAWIGGTSSYQTLSGTSAAASYVTAFFAMTRLYNRCATREELIGLVGDCAADLGESGRDAYYGAGIPVFPDGRVMGPRLERPVFFEARVNDTKYAVLYWETVPGGLYSIHCVDMADGSESTRITKRASETWDHYTCGPLLPEHTYAFYVSVSGVDAYENTVSEQVELEIPWYNDFVPTSNVAGSAILQVGEGYQITASGNADAVVYYSGDERIATVSESGYIVGVSAGETQIIREVQREGKTTRYGYNVTVWDSSLSCGEGLTWTIVEEDGDCILVIGGEGEMDDYNMWSSLNQERKVPPWYYKRDSITRVQIGDGVRSIGSFAFSYMKNLSSVEGAAGLTGIHGNAFYASGTEASPFHIELPEGLEDITARAFEQAHFDEMTIPSTVSLLGKEAFLDSTGFVNVSADNAFYSSEDGVIYDKEKTRLLYCSGEKTGELVLPDSIREIDDRAFGYHCNVKTLRFSEGMETIPALICLGVHSIEKVILPDGCRTIEEFAFQGCTALKEVELPDSLECIGKAAFSGTSLVQIRFPNSLKEIGLAAFGNCENLGNVELPVSLETIGEHAFDYGALRQQGDPVRYPAFSKRFRQISGSQENDLADVWIAVEGTEGNLSWLAEGFSGDLQLTVSGAGTMPDYEETEDVPWFDGREEITRVVIGEGVEYVGSFSFCNAPVLNSAEIPQSVNDYGENAFLLTPALKSFTYLPDSEERIDIQAEYLSAVYTGRKYEPGLVISSRVFGELVPDEDYTVSYSNTENVGGGLITVQFAGRCAEYGSVRLPFTVLLKNVDGTNVLQFSSAELSEAEFTADGTVHTPEVIVRSGRWTLKNQVDYRLIWSSGRIEPGTYQVQIVGIGAYEGADPITLEFVIVGSEAGEDEAGAAGGGSADPAEEAGEKEPIPAQEEGDPGSRQGSGAIQSDALQSDETASAESAAENGPSEKEYAGTQTADTATPASPAGEESAEEQPVEKQVTEEQPAEEQPTEGNASGTPAANTPNASGNDLLIGGIALAALGAALLILFLVLRRKKDDE